MGNIWLVFIEAGIVPVFVTCVYKVKENLVQANNEIQRPLSLTKTVVNLYYISNVEIQSD